jgi:methylphosphotriester-DNA--protein-cysteine methyltransferase
MLLSLLSGFISISHNHQRMAGNVPAKRATTRRLLLGRLQRAKEMIEDLQGRPPPPDELAQAESLSKFHLLRLFKATFDASPSEYAGHNAKAVKLAKQRLGVKSLKKGGRWFWTLKKTNR